VIKYGLRKLLAASPDGLLWLDQGGDAPPTPQTPPAGAPPATIDQWKPGMPAPVGYTIDPSTGKPVPGVAPNAPTGPGTFHPTGPGAPTTPTPFGGGWDFGASGAEGSPERAEMLLHQALSNGLSGEAAITWAKSVDPTAGGLIAYYPDNNTFGLPNGYSSFDNGAWGFTPKGAGGPSAASGDLIAPWTQQFSFPDWKPPSPFQAPTALTETNDPGFQARLALGTAAIDMSSAAKGGFGTQTLQQLENYGQTFASNEYQNVYNRSLQDYNTTYNASLNDWTTNYNKAFQGFQTSYNIFENNQANAFNRINSVLGETMGAVNQLTNAGLSTTGLTAGALGNNSTTAGGLYTQGGNANASGIASQANLFGATAGNLGSMLNNPYWQNQNQSGYQPPSYQVPTSTPNGAPPYNPYGQ
jgi:hypothetical protein